MAHGDKAEPLNKIARRIKSLATGDVISIFAKLAPLPCPIKINFDGSPLNDGKFSRSQCKPATKSIKPKLPCALPFAPVFKKPNIQTKLNNDKIEGEEEGGRREKIKTENGDDAVKMEEKKQEYFLFNCLI